MKNFYNVTTAVKETLEGHPMINTVTFGDLDDIDLNKQTIFPLAHIVVDTANFQGTTFNTIAFDMQIIVMDLVDVTKNDLRDQPNPFQGQDNLQDVLNTMLAPLNNLVLQLNKGSMQRDGYELDMAQVPCVPFLDRYQNKLAGWIMTLTVNTKNTEISIC
jgi:hypothetical protein